MKRSLKLLLLQCVILYSILDIYTCHSHFARMRKPMYPCLSLDPPPPPPLGVSVAKHRAPVLQTCGLGRASSDTSKNFRFEVQTCSWKTVIGASCPPAPQSYRCHVILTEPRVSANQIMLFLSAHSKKSSCFLSLLPSTCCLLRALLWRELGHNKWRRGSDKLQK